MERDTLLAQDACTHKILDSYLKLYKRYAPDTNILKTRSKVRVTVTQEWYVTLCPSKMHAHTKCEIPTSNNMRYVYDTIITKLGQKSRSQ